MPDDPNSSLLIETRTFYRKKWAHVFGIRRKRVDEDSMGRLKWRLERTVKYLHERFTRVHPEYLSGGVGVAITDGMTDYFIRGQVAVVGTWWVFDDVPAAFSPHLAEIAAGLRAEGGSMAYQLAVASDPW